MNSRTQGQLYVALQFGLLLALAALCAMEMKRSFPGLVPWLYWLVGIALGLWTLTVNRPGNFHIHPEPRQGGQLVQSGPYRWLRHPMYSSVLLLAAGGAFWLASIVGWALFASLAAVLVAKAKLEEERLLRSYPQYAEYQRKTWRLIPWIY